MLSPDSSASVFPTDGRGRSPQLWAGACPPSPGGTTRAATGGRLAVGVAGEAAGAGPGNPQTRKADGGLGSRVSAAQLPSSRPAALISGVWGPPDNTACCEQGTCLLPEKLVPLARSLISHGFQRMLPLVSSTPTHTDVFITAVALKTPGIRSPCTARGPRQRGAAVPPRVTRPGAPGHHTARRPCRAEGRASSPGEGVPGEGGVLLAESPGWRVGVPPEGEAASDPGRARLPCPALTSTLATQGSPRNAPPRLPLLSTEGGGPSRMMQPSGPASPEGVPQASPWAPKLHAGPSEHGLRPSAGPAAVGALCGHQLTHQPVPPTAGAGPRVRCETGPRQHLAGRAC